MVGGPITATGTVSVLANTGIVANATGVFVNSAYIATIASNSATYANSSVTNAFTVGTASYFVSNGNLGVGTSSPISKIHIQSGGSPRLLTIQSTDADSSSGIGLTNDAREWAISVRADLSDALAIRDITTNEDRVTITSSGNVGIGNSSPTNTLSVNGTTYLQANVTLNAALIANGSSGTAGQVLSSNGTVTYWATASGGSSAVTTSDTAPGSPTDGTLWWNSSLGKMFIYYDDGTSSQWVESSPALAAPERSYDYAIAYALKSISF